MGYGSTPLSEIFEFFCIVITGKELFIVLDKLMESEQDTLYHGEL